MSRAFESSANLDLGYCQGFAGFHSRYSGPLRFPDCLQHVAVYCTVAGPVVKRVGVERAALVLRAAPERKLDPGPLGEAEVSSLADDAAAQLTAVHPQRVVRLVTAASVGTSLDSAANVQTVAIATSGANAQSVVAALQVAIPSAVLVSSPNGKAIVVAGSPAAVKRARDIVAGLTFDPGASLPTSTIVGLRYISAGDAAKLLSASDYADASTTNTMMCPIFDRRPACGVICVGGTLGPSSPAVAPPLSRSPDSSAPPVSTTPHANALSFPN